MKRLQATLTILALAALLDCASYSQTFQWHISSSGPTSYYDCRSQPIGDGWRTMDSAPRDGTVIELAQTYGVAAWYGTFKWISDNSRWQDTNDPHKGMSENCAFWRPVSDVAHYVDPTGGAQNSVKYWCDAMHVRYDPKRDRCVTK